MGTQIMAIANRKEKKYMGVIERWKKLPVESGLGFYVTGRFIGHPTLRGALACTSPIVVDEGGFVETLDYRYELGTEHE
jgi:hypothetical protein